MTPHSSLQMCMISSIAINVLMVIMIGAWIGFDWENIHDALFGSTNRKTPLHVMVKGNMSGDAVALTEESVCISCDYLGDTVLAHETLYSDVVITGCEHKLCCLKDQEIRNFLRSIMNGKESNSMTKTSLGWWKNRPSSAHFYMDKDTPIKNKNLRWKLADSHDAAFEQDIELLNKTHMKVNSAGLYYVYSATTFDLGSRGLISPFYQTLDKSHIELGNTEDPFLVYHKLSGSILKNKHTIFMSGIFLLEKDYGISIALSKDGQQFLDTSSIMKNYIGIYKIYL